MHSSGIRAEVRFGFFLYLFCVCSLIDGANKLHFTQNKLCFFYTFVPHISGLYIKRFSLYVLLASLPPLHTDLRKLCSFRCAARVLKMSIIHWGHLCCVYVCCFCCATTRKKIPKKVKRTKIKKQLRAHATFTKASNTPKKNQSKQTRKSMKNNNNIN